MHAMEQLRRGDRSDKDGLVERARNLVTECGYGRREREVAWLGGRLADS